MAHAEYLEDAARRQRHRRELERKRALAELRHREELEKIAEREEMDRKVRAVKEKAAKQERSRRAMMRAEARMHMHKGKEGGNVRRVLDNTSVVKTNLMKIDALSLYESQ